MLRSYYREDMQEEAVFSLFFRHLPERRNFMLACGLEAVLRYLEELRFEPDDLAYLGTLGLFEADFLERLSRFVFTGDVYAVPEGTPVFPNEPLLEIVAPIPQAQLVESMVMNQIHLETVLASNAARVVAAARGRPVVDFALRRMHGADAALRGARAFYVAGVTATSNVLAGQRFGIPVAGTMAHSYIQAHDSERDAFRIFAELYPETTLLVDTYDTLRGVHEVIGLFHERPDVFRVAAIRLDSGDLGALAREARALLDRAGLPRVRIFASSDLDAERIEALLDSGAPIDAFGVGTRMGTSLDAPSLGLAYKLTEYAGRGRLKTSACKRLLPGRKQVFRTFRDNCATSDVIARACERRSGQPLLERVMEGGTRVGAGLEGLDAARTRAAEQIARLPAHVRALEPAIPAYPVRVSEALHEYAEAVRREVAG